MSIKGRFQAIGTIVDTDQINIKTKQHLLGYILIAPAVILILGLIAYPLVFNVYLSLTEVPLNPTKPVEWIGLSHYFELISNSRFWRSILITFAYTVSSDIIATVGGLAIALLFTREFRAKGLARALVLIPYIAPLVAGAYIWRWMFHPVNGIITHYGVQLNFFSPTPEPLTNLGSALAIVILFDAWRHIPFAFLFFTARLQAIPEALYEAAEIDGASKIAVFKDITLPELKYTIAIVMLLRFIWNFHKFAPVWLVTKHVETLSVFTFKMAFASFEYGTAAAISIIIVLILLILATVYMRYIMEDW